MVETLLPSFFVGGFECSTKKYWDGRRLDLLESTGHFKLAAQDYEQCFSAGILGARDGLRWNLIGAEVDRYDWSSILPMLHAAKASGITVAWDLCHFGYPDRLEFQSETFVEEFGAYALKAAQLIHDETRQPLVLCPINEVSFWSWLAGKEGKIAPMALDHPGAVKQQLVRAKLSAIARIRDSFPDATFFCAEPIIRVLPHQQVESQITEAAFMNEGQFEAIDMLLGRRDPDLGGDISSLDVIGVNYYPHNQWFVTGNCIPMGQCNYEDFSNLLIGVWKRYQKPIFIAETGAEGSGRAAWLSYVGQEVRVAQAAGVPILGVCIYPITAYPGWDNDRDCPTGLFSSVNCNGQREVYRPLLDELERQTGLFARE
jgi:hypothetical protein